MNKFCLSLLIIGIFFFISNCKTSPEETVEPVIIKLRSSQVVIGWESEKPNQGSLFYRLASSDDPPSSVKEKPGESRQHEVTIIGLKPGTLYTYWFGEKGKHHQFRTQPDVNQPFTFMMMTGPPVGQVLQSLESEIFDFYLSLVPIKDEAMLLPFRSRVPVFDTCGRVAFNGDSLDQSSEKKAELNWYLDWGGLRLVFLDDPAKLTPLLDTPRPHTFGMVTNSSLIKSFDASSDLHKALLVHNQEHPAAPVSFVMVLGTKEETAELEGIRYLAIPVKIQKDAPLKGKAIRVEVDVENIRAVFMDEDKEILLRTPPLQGRRTCQECRRLADKGAYRESIAAYKEFIETNTGHYQVDDACFAIAEIYDEKLFLYPEALSWYKRLIHDYPRGSLTPLASQRIQFLTRYSADDLKILRPFEQIKKVEFSRKKDQREELEKLLERVTALVSENPNSKPAPEMQYWVANRYRQFSMEKALAAYNLLRTNYPGSKEAKEAAIEIGETYYNAGFYDKAIVAFEKALAELPDRTQAIHSQIQRTSRNLRRDVIANYCLIFLILLTLFIVLLKPRGLDLSKISHNALAFIILLIVFTFVAWMIREQFVSTGTWLLLVLLFSFNIALSSLLSTNFALKVMPKGGPVARTIVGSLMGILFFIAGLYLIIYYVNVHFLVLFKL